MLRLIYQKQLLHARKLLYLCLTLLRLAARGETFHIKQRYRKAGPCVLCAPARIMHLHAPRRVGGIARV